MSQFTLFKFTLVIVVENEIRRLPQKYKDLITKSVITVQIRLYSTKHGGQLATTTMRQPQALQAHMNYNEL